jgi:ribosomal protein S13
MNFMKLSVILLMMASLITLGKPAGIFADARDEQEQKYQSLLKKLKASPEHHNQLLKNYRSFQALPQEKQKTLKDLDNAIFQLIKSYDSFQTLGKEKQIALKKTAGKLDSQEAGRLLEVFQKFGEWYEALDLKEKDRLAKASYPDERIAEIKKILTSQWISRLPKVDSDALLKLDEPMRAIQIVKMKKEEQIRVAQSFDKKKKVGLLSEETQKFITQIKQQLSSEQLEKLGKLEGKKGAFVKMILDFAEDNPPLPLNKMGVKYLSSKDLPPEVSARLKSLKQTGVYKSFELIKIEKKWPAFARGVTEIIRRSDPAFNYEFGACKFEDLPEDVRVVVNELLQMLQDDEMVKLQAVEGKWPDYPLMLRDLARVHLVIIPGISIPPELLQLKPGKVPVMLR